MLSAVGMQLDTVDNRGDVSSLYAKRRIQQFPFLEVPIAFPNTVNLVFDDVDNNQYALRISDSGELFWTLYGNRSPVTLFAPESLFWEATEPVLNLIPPAQDVVSINPPDLVSASYAGTYRGENGYSGKLARRRLEDEPGFWNWFSEICCERVRMYYVRDPFRLRNPGRGRMGGGRVILATSRCPPIFPITSKLPL
jgi:hypothetical protein